MYDFYDGDIAIETKNRVSISLMTGLNGLTPFPRGCGSAVGVRGTVRVVVMIARVDALGLTRGKLRAGARAIALHRSALSGNNLYFLTVAARKTE